MADYSRKFGSQFPETVMGLKEYKDIGEASESVQRLAQNYYAFMENGDFASAATLLEENWVDLEKYYIGMDFLNNLEEEIYNTQVFAQKNNAFIMDTEEPNATESTYATPWLKPIE